LIPSSLCEVGASSPSGLLDVEDAGQVLHGCVAGAQRRQVEPALDRGKDRLLLARMRGRPLQKFGPTREKATGCLVRVLLHTISQRSPATIGSCEAYGT
jgi:hypothetical protein